MDIYCFSKQLSCVTIISAIHSSRNAGRPYDESDDLVHTCKAGRPSNDTDNTNAGGLASTIQTTSPSVFLIVVVSSAYYFVT